MNTLLTRESMRTQSVNMYEVSGMALLRLFLLTPTQSDVTGESPAIASEAATHFGGPVS